jgi:hypothetical protein
VSAAPRLVTGTPLATRTAQELVAEDLGEIPWLIPSFVAAGGFTIVYGAPKSGKTTLCAHMAAACIQSRLFLGGESCVAYPVLWLDLEQSRRVTQRRLFEINAHRGVETMHVWAGRPPASDELLATIDQTGAPVVFVDSLSRWLLLEDENDNAELTRALGRILPAFQERDVALVAIHHDRKSEGESGRNIRGASALLAACDVAIECRKEKEGEEYGNLRKLTIVSRHEAERVTSVRLTADGFVEEGPPAKRQDALILAQLAYGPQTVEMLKEPLSLSAEALRTRLGALHDAGRIARAGRGRPHDPYLFSLSPTLPHSPKQRAGDSLPLSHPFGGGGSVGDTDGVRTEFRA